MASLNKVHLIGALGRDPETKFLPTGTQITTFSIATTEKYKDKENTSWHNIISFGKLAEICGQYLVKGSSVYIEGRLKYESWEKDGVKRTATKIVAERMQMLGGKRKENQGGHEADYDGPPTDDDTPF